MLVLPKPLWERVVAHCLDSLPFEGCGLLAGFDPAIVESGPADSPAWSVVPSGQVLADASTGRVGPAGNATASEAQHYPRHVHCPAQVQAVYPAGNAARSARLYTVEPRDLLAADRAAEQAGCALIGVWHSHTHTPAYPSPTDIAQAPDPAWHYVVVSLADSEPVLRSYRIVDGTVHEEPVATGGV